MNRRRIIRGVILTGIAAALVYAVLLALADAPATLAAVRDLPGRVIATMLGLAVVGFIVRGIRWGWLMRTAGYPVAFKDAMYINLAGLSMAITPGRVGELIKSWLARDVAGMPLPSGIALLFGERVADLIGVCLLALGGLTVLGGNSGWLVLALVVIAAGTWLSSTAWFHGVALRWLSKQPRLRDHQQSAEEISAAVRAALCWRTMLWSVPASALSWGLEGIGFALCVDALGFDGLGPAVLVSVFAVSTIVGAFSFLPGGIGLTEASLAGILVGAGMAASGAGAATIIVRATTLWWGVLLGWIALLSRPGLLRGAFLANDGTRG